VTYVHERFPLVPPRSSFEVSGLKEKFLLDDVMFAKNTFDGFANVDEVRVFTDTRELS